MKILTYHVVKANAMSDAIGKMIKDDGGKHTIKTVSGGTLVAMMKGDKLVLHDENEAHIHREPSPTSSSPTA